MSDNTLLELSFPTMKSLGGSEVKKSQEKAEEKAVLE